MNVLKFGGSSVANPQNIEKVVQIIANASINSPLIVVVSAFGKTTNKLIASAEQAAQNNTNYLKNFKEVELVHFEVINKLVPENQQEEVKNHINSLFKQLKTLLEGCFLLNEITPKTLATISGFGELLSSYIIANIASKELDVVYKDSRELISTSNDFDKAQVDFKLTNSNCKAYFSTNKHQITLLPGFIARTKEGKSTTLGRGGSDYSAAIYAAAINAEELQIWTDVSGMYTANPHLVKQAFPIPHISYQEAMELSHFGAKVIYPPTIQPVLEKEIPIRIKNTFDPENAGTLISKITENGKPVKGISHIENITLLTLEGSGMVGVSGISKRLFETLSLHNINVVLITQASSEHSICIGIYDEDAEKASLKINEAFAIEIERHKIDPIIVEQGLAIIALVGDKMRNHQGLSGQMFSSLGKNNVNIRAIAQGASEKNISAVINSSDAKKALNTLHEQFFEEKVKQLNLFVTGVGNVGERFLAQIHQQKKYLKEQLKLNVRVVGVSNSKKMVFDESGISLKSWKEQLQNGEASSLDLFFQRIKALNLRNSVFIDNTANQQVSEVYERYLANNIGVVTCNKIACASELNNYKKLKHISHKYNTPFLFETNVGAGLPIIDTLKNLIASGDRVHKIQAVLSGSLNFVFNNFNENISFHDVVQQAQEQGYTEPDPKIDLSGVDVARKILILARESGYELELSDIENNAFLPEKSIKTTNNEDFYASLIEFESHFQQIYKEASNKNCRLKYVAEFNDGKASVGLQHIPFDHPFYNLEGSDNIVLFFTDRYPVNPLQIKGAGAGAEVTASGIFADVIRIGNQ
ncbi:bifunctional aspartate kinase/homoserine dehydrogenase I [Tenacibaculum discolor]|uniref:Bifunctional aspartate kinase/homoserine dehydrogenase I n=1 Tax=Tenacibaculum discolor TaxID=361581 RepID=A0A2G1BXA3_9FLAO|nr:bifunctional aspartate kinase/homoserine dehydrogenase I [Tenacibaculum discolor]MDP2540726.1 bifunctional aspartate kinase/homoserine dehydrogenase I [Tenacibaculum discolor]PHN98681.1 bifunctional aspartate kinase/homoserine dehydrogenase I [Tenacibaculum discolor]